MTTTASAPAAEPARVHGDVGELWVGLDTGGTYTDAVALDAAREVIASAKALTTHWDLSIGLGEALAALLAALPHGYRRDHISLLSVSTTLATNAVVENRFTPVCTLLIGFDEAIIERAGLRRVAGGCVVRVPGGHDATGAELCALGSAAVAAAVDEFDAQVAAYAVAGMFSVRNPAHELAARELIRARTRKPVTCSHELSSQLDAPKRALTATLNARLTPQIRQLLEALRQVLSQHGISAPVLVVKGDGTLMQAQLALEYPVETVLSGPAASVVGAGFLSGLEDFAVADMGGTTTDVAIVLGARPVVRAEGAVIGGWRTMVEAVDVRTCGLGGDSEVYLDREQRLAVGPRKAMPLSLLAQQFPPVLERLRLLAASERPSPGAARLAFRNPGRSADAHLDRLERRIWEGLGPAPRLVNEIARTAPGLEALRRLVDRGLATFAAFTPSDAMHVLGSQRDWNTQAARLGALVLATEERNATARTERDTAEALCERVREQVVRRAARVLLECALAHDPGLELKAGHWGTLGSLVEPQLAGRAFSRLIEAPLRIAVPLIAIGAPVASYYPEVARRLGARLLIPPHAAVCNAVGAVAGVVSATVDILVNQPTLKVFRVHDPAGSRDYPEVQAAIADARRVSRELALAAARRAGARDLHIETTVLERTQLDGALEYVGEATVRSRATGRPASGAMADK